LTEKIINGFYFEIARIGKDQIRIAAFVTPGKPNIMSNPVPNERTRIQALQGMFSRLRNLSDYKIAIIDKKPTLLKAQEVMVQVAGIRADIRRKDRSEISDEEIEGLIEENLSAPHS